MVKFHSSLFLDPESGGEPPSSNAPRFGPFLRPLSKGRHYMALWPVSAFYFERSQSAGVEKPLSERIIQDS
jgi:hypothetical protein